MISNCPGHSYIKDEKGRFVDSDVSLAEYAGFDSVKNLIGKNDFEFVWSEQAPDLRRVDLSVMKLNRPITIEEHIKICDGTLLTVVSEKHPYIKNGEICGIVGTSIITYRTPAPASAEFINIATQEILNVTPRQSVCLDHLLTGMPPKAIAQNMNVSPRTIEHHLDAIRQQNNLDSLREILLFVKKL